MKVLLVDKSGRGHAFADLLTRTNPEVTVHYAPGCSAISTERVVSIQTLSLSNPAGMVNYALQEGIDFAFVTNAGALAAGFVDAFEAGGLPVIGPDRAASQLESSKIWAKHLFSCHGIPTPQHQSFSDVDLAHEFVRSARYQVVVKADGLCGGNGAFVCDTPEDAKRAIDRLMVERIFGTAGARIVIEERIYGTEFSFFAFIDGSNYVVFPMAVDYPKSDDGNRGVISGGMGAVSHHPLEREVLVRKVENELLIPVLNIIAEEKLRYSGPIYLGCMLVQDQPFLLEINVRMGDPEAEVVLPRIESDFLDTCQATLGGRLLAQKLELNNLYFCDTVATQGPTRALSPGDPPSGFPGWPFGEFSRHHPVFGLNKVCNQECKVFLGEATVLPNIGLVSDGGRVLHLVGFGNTLEQAAKRSQMGISQIHFNGIRYRSDIGIIMPWDAA
jgi:phosphoribosylamine--glycine ligase